MKYIPLKHVYPKDTRCMGILAKSGAMDRDTFHKMEITDNRIKSYLHAGLIKETSVVDTNGNGFKTYYELDKKEKNFVDKNVILNILSLMPMLPFTMPRYQNTL